MLSSRLVSISTVSAVYLTAVKAQGPSIPGDIAQGTGIPEQGPSATEVRSMMAVWGMGDTGYDKAFYWLSKLQTQSYYVQSLVIPYRLDVQDGAGLVASYRAAWSRYPPVGALRSSSRTRRPSSMPR